MNINELNLDSSLADLSQESALLHKKRECTKEALAEEITLMRTASERIDVLNLRSGPFTKTVLSKIAICREILSINGEHLPEQKLLKITKYLQDIENTVNRKLKYGKRLDKYLDKKENDIIEVIKSNLFESDLEQYGKIQAKLVSYRNRMIETCDKLLRQVRDKKKN